MNLQSDVRHAVSDCLTKSAAAYFLGDHERAARLRIHAFRLRRRLIELRSREWAQAFIRRIAA